MEEEAAVRMGEGMALVVTGVGVLGAAATSGAATTLVCKQHLVLPMQLPVPSPES